MWFSSQPAPAGDHQALCFPKAVNARPSWFLKRTAEAKVWGLSRSVTDSVELKRGTLKETIIFGKTVSSVNFVALADTMLQCRDHCQSLFKGTNKQDGDPI